MRRSHIAFVLAAGASLACLAPPEALAGADLIPRISIQQPAGWDSPIVARLSAGAVASDPLATAGALPPTQPVWLNWAVSANAGVGGHWTDQMLVDGEIVQTLPRWNGTFAARSWYALDAGPVYLPGGRHTLSVLADVTGRIEYGPDRADNRQDRSLVWTPDPMGIAGSAVFGEGAPPPAPSAATYPNNRAYSFSHGTGAWVLGLRPSVDYDLQLFDDFASSTDGLAHLVAQSTRSGDSLEILVGGGSSAPATVYPAVVARPGAGESGFMLHWNDNAGHPPFVGDGYWDAESLWVNRVVNLYEIDLEAGHAYPMSVWTREGAYHAHFAVFPGDPAFVGNLGQALARSQAVAGQDYEIATFTPTTSGRYLIIVFRDVADATVTRFQLAVGSQAVGVGAGLPNGVWLGASPNPSRAGPRLRFRLPEAAHARIEVLDVQGRLVRTVFDAAESAGTHDLRWDLRDASGSPVAPGLYWARLDVGGQKRLARLSVLR